MDSIAPNVCRWCGGRGLRAAGCVRGYVFVECRSCGFTFTPDVTPDAMETLYAEGWHGPADGAPATGWNGDEFLAPALERLARRGPLTVLDYGTGQSRVPDRLRARGHRVVAVDVVPPLRPHPDRLTGSALDLDLPRRRFDLVYAFQVFEHLPAPRPVFDRLLELVRPGGLLLVHTDMETPERGARLADWWYVLPPDHCAFFRHRSFEAALEGTPHRLVGREPKAVLVEAG